MKKTALAIAAVAVSLASLTVSVTASAQPGPHRPGFDQRHDRPMARPHAKRKVWVPAHREHGRMVRGHYVWR